MRLNLRIQPHLFLRAPHRASLSLGGHIGIGDIDKEEGMTGHGGAGTATVFLLNHLTERIDTHLATSHLEEGAHNGTHHVAQEAVGLDDKAPLVLAHLFPMGLHDAAVVGSHIGVELTETGEVNIVEESASSLVHERKVGRMEEPHRAVTVEGILGRGHVVVVGARGGTEACMGIGLHGLHLLHGDVLGKQAIELVGKTGAIDLLLGIEVGYHLQGMHTGIGAAGTDNGCLLTKKCREGLLQALLHGDAIGLYLPAMVGCAIVGQGDEVTHDRRPPPCPSRGGVTRTSRRIRTFQRI